MSNEVVKKYKYLGGYQWTTNFDTVYQELYKEVKVWLNKNGISIDIYTDIRTIIACYVSAADNWMLKSKSPKEIEEMHEMIMESNKLDAQLEGKLGKNLAKECSDMMFKFVCEHMTRRIILR